MWIPAPEFVKRLAQEITVDEGATVCFDCKVVAFPNPTITWTKDGETLPDDTRYLAETVNNGEYSLKISDVTKKDEAAYRCRAENVEGSSSSTIYLAVKGIRTFSPLDLRVRFCLPLVCGCIFCGTYGLFLHRNFPQREHQDVSLRQSI